MREYIVRIDLAPDGVLVYHRPHGEIVRCKDCVFFECGIRCVWHNNAQKEANDFCSRGIRRTE